MAEQEVAALQKDMEELENVRKSLAEFFCEDPNTFKLEDCFKIIHGFCIKFKQAVAENERRKLQEEQTYLRRKQREEQLAAKRRQREFFNCSLKSGNGRYAALVVVAKNVHESIFISSEFQ